MKHQFELQIRHIFKENQSGITLIEILATVAILSTVGVAFLSALITSVSGAGLAKEESMAESIAQSQLEFIADQDYQSFDSMPPSYAEVTCPDNWDVEVTPQLVDIDGNLDDDDGVQDITVAVYHYGENIFTATAYKTSHSVGE